MVIPLFTRSRASADSRASAAQRVDRRLFLRRVAGVAAGAAVIGMVGSSGLASGDVTRAGADPQVGLVGKEFVENGSFEDFDDASTPIAWTFAA
jgi:hypothetical protein